MKPSVVSLCSILLLSLFHPFFLMAQEMPEPESDESIDDPFARVEYERMRLADPATGRIPEGIRRRELEFAATIPTRESLMNSGKEAQPLALLADWIGRGPTNQGGRTRAVAIDRTNESVILAGAVSGGMWRSEDTGRSWTRVTDPDQLQSVTCVVQDPRPGAGHIWYYGTGEVLGSASAITGEGLFKSTDGGRSWFSLLQKERSLLGQTDSMLQYVQAVVVDPSNLDQDEVYTACRGGILRSTDGGVTWKKVLGDFPNGPSYCDVAITSKGVVYATLSTYEASGDGIWRSEDGENWTEITPPNFPQMFLKLSIAIAPSFEDVVYFFGPGYPTPQHHTLWFYRNRGSLAAVWNDRSSNLPAGLNTYSSYCQALSVSPLNEEVLFLGSMFMYRSKNGFIDANVGLGSMPGLHLDQHAFAFFPSNPNMMISAHDGGISFTRDGMAGEIQWEFRNEGYVTTQFYAIAIDPSGRWEEMILGGTQDNGTWRVDDGEPSAAWKQIGGGDGGFCEIADSGRTLYISSQNGAMRRLLLDDDGVGIGAANFGPPTSSARFTFINPFAIDPSDDGIMYVLESRELWRANNLTADLSDWTKLDNASIPPADWFITSLGLSQRNPSHRLYYGTVTGKLYRLEGANTGDPISREVSNGAFPEGAVNSIAIDPNDGDNVLVAISNYGVRSLFYSSDGGETWSDVSGNLEEFRDGSGNGPAVVSVALLTVENRPLYFAGTTTGLYSTTELDGDDTRWVHEGASTIGNAWVTMIKARESDGFVAVGTHGRGIFSAHVSGSFVPATIGVTSDEIDFGAVRIGTTRRDTAILTNGAGSTRKVRAKAQTPNDPFSIVAASDEFDLEPSGERKIILTFTPDSVGTFIDSLLVDHNATDPRSPILIRLSGRGISTSGIGEERRDGADVMALSGYPNPFAKSIELHFVLKTAANVALKILAVDGTEIATLIDGRRMEAGEHNILWTPSNSANGTYYVRLEAGSERTMIPIVLER